MLMVVTGKHQGHKHLGKTIRRGEPHVEHNKHADDHRKNFYRINAVLAFDG